MADELTSEHDLVLPLVTEQATVDKTVVHTGRVRIATRVEERRQLISEALEHNDVNVERITIDRIVDVAPDVRLEGDVLIYPVVEETLVVEKRFILKEEVRISRKTRIEMIDREVTLRSVHADVERTPAD